jgi:RimJ/RimL family protein N-acetyltransferase
MRPLELNDFNSLLLFSENEPDLWFYSLTPADGSHNLKKYIQSALLAKENNKTYPFIIFDKRKHKPAGCTRFYEIDEQHNTLSIAYTWYGKEFQRTGLNRNCKKSLLTYAFKTLKVDRVEFRADSKNTKSIKAMKEIVCVEEGILRSNCNAIEGRRDSIVLSVLKSEWNDGVKTYLDTKLY